MNIGKYTLRSAKYLLKLCVLFAVLFTIMQLTGTSTLSTENFFAEFYGSTRGQLFCAIVLVWCIYYPKVEFISQSVPVRYGESRDSVVEAMNSLGMVLTGEDENGMTFRSGNMLVRLWQMFEDEVTVKGTTRGIEISGSRKSVANASFKIKLYMERNTNE